MQKLMMWLTVLTFGLAFAHAELISADPASGSVLTTPPETVTLQFTESVEVRYSTFKLYALELPEDLTLARLTDLGERERQRLNALAATLVSEVLEAENDEEARADTGVLTEARTGAEIVLEVQDALPAGVYVVMWDVLSIDTHWTSGHYLFIVNPLEY